MNASPVPSPIAVGLLLAAASLSTCIAHAANQQKDPGAVLDALADRIYVLSETGGNAAAMAAAETGAADDIRAYIASGASAGLLATEGNKQAPLLTAAYMGYPNVVAALLTSSLVKAHIDDADSMGMTPWIAANFSIRQSLWSCNPQVVDDPFKFVPMLLTQPYYTSKPVPPYQKARALLEKAGATRDMAAAKALWLNRCTGQSDQTRRQVTDGADLQKTVQAVGAADLNALLHGLQDKMRKP